jgi:hypothetical protein
MSDSNTIIASPVYYRIIQRRGNGWAFKEGEPFINLFNAPLLSQEDIFAAFKTSMKKVAMRKPPLRERTFPYQWWKAGLLHRKYFG